MNENFETKQNWWPVCFISLGCAIAALTGIFSIYYTTFPKTFVQTIDVTPLAIAGWIGTIVAVILFGLALALYLKKVDRSLLLGLVMAVLSVAIIAMSFLIQMWFLFTVAGLLCLFGSLCQIVDFSRLAASEN